MTLCEKCLHAEVCAIRDGQDEGDEIAMTYCSDFQGWISVEDRLPEDYNKYLLFLDNGRIAIGWYHGSAMQFVEDGIVMIETVTHWMPLPEAPKMKGGEE